MGRCLHVGIHVRVAEPHTPRQAMPVSPSWSMVKAYPWEGMGRMRKSRPSWTWPCWGSHARVSDPEAKTDRVGCSSNPARTLVVAGTSLGVCPVGYEVYGI